MRFPNPNIVAFYFAWSTFGIALWLALSAFGGGGAVPPCTATPPAQATTAGLTNLVLCNNLATNQQVDTNQLETPGFSLYTTDPDSLYKNGAPQAFTNDGTGLTANGAAAVSTYGGTLYSPGFSSVSPYNVGVGLTGSFYVEMDEKFNPIEPTPAPSGWNAFWFRAANYSVNGVYTPANFPFVEIDVMECLPQSAGQTCLINQQLHTWSDVSGSGSENCSYAGATYSAHNAVPTISNYNTYGILYQTMADGGGTGGFYWYTNNVLTNQCTYTNSTVTCLYGSQGTNNGGPLGCAIAGILSAETELFGMLIGGGGGSGTWPITTRNVHIWQK